MCKGKKKPMNVCLGRGGEACVGFRSLRWPTCAVVGCCGPLWACVGLPWAAVGLRWPSLAAVGCCGPSWACVGLLWAFVAVVRAEEGCCGSGSRLVIKIL